MSCSLKKRSYEPLTDLAAAAALAAVALTPATADAGWGGGWGLGFGIYVGPHPYYRKYGYVGPILRPLRLSLWAALEI